MELQENVLEWTTGQRNIAVTFSEAKYIRKIKELAEKYPDDVKIIAENKDGSIFAHIPKSALKLNIVKRDMTEEQRKAIGKRLHSSSQK